MRNLLVKQSLFVFVYFVIAIGVISYFYQVKTERAIHF